PAAQLRGRSLRLPMLQNAGTKSDSSWTTRVSAIKGDAAHDGPKEGRDFVSSNRPAVPLSSHPTCALLFGDELPNHPCFLHRSFACAARPCCPEECEWHHVFCFSVDQSGHACRKTRENGP